MSALVSVVIPAYNCAATIDRAITSVTTQDYTNIEIIVVDDASVDATRRVLEPWVRRGVRVISRDRNRGASSARNSGITESRGEYVAFLDADDIWLPGKLTRQIKILKNNPRVALATCDCEILDESGKVLKRTHAQHPPVSGPLGWKALLARNFIPTPTVVARRAELLRIGGFDARLPIAEDLDLWIRLGLQGDIGVVPQVFVRVYDRPGSLMKMYARDEERIVLSIVERYLREERSSFKKSEMRAIVGQRFFKIGAKFYAAGCYRDSLRPFLRSTLARYRPVKSIVNVARALAIEVLFRRAATKE